MTDNSWKCVHCKKEIDGGEVYVVVITQMESVVEYYEETDISKKERYHTNCYLLGLPSKKNKCPFCGFNDTKMENIANHVRVDHKNELV